MSYSHRIQRRRQQRRSRRLTIGAGVLGIVVVAVVLALLRTGGGEDETLDQAGAAPQGGRSVALPRAERPAAAGRPLTVRTAEGYTYRLEGVSAGTSPDALPGAVPTSPTQTYAYADYILTNAGRAPALLEYPADIFLRRTLVPAQVRARCVPISGAAGSCTLPSDSRLVARLGNSPAPTSDAAGDAYRPPGGSYLVRAVINTAVSGDVSAEDLGLYVWQVRYNGARLAKPVRFPG
jgi:hypothetical protein